MDALLVADERERALGVPERVLSQALDYVLADRVTDAVVQGRRAAARIQGARDDYRAEVQLEPFGRTRCTCGRAQPCRHSVAVAVAHLRRPEAFVHLAEGGGPLADAVFAFAAGRPDPLAALVAVPKTADAPGTEPDWSEVGQRAPAAAFDRLWRHLEAAGTGRGDPATTERVATTVAALAGRGPVPADLARRVARLVADGSDPRLEGALTGWLLALAGDARDGARIALEHVVWADADLGQDGAGDTVGAGGAARARRIRRSLAVLCELGRDEGGDEAALAVARAHRPVAGAGACEAETLARLGRVDEAARVAQAAYLHADDADEAARLYGLLVALGRAGAAGVADFLRSLWEAQPDAVALDELLALGDEATRAETRRAVERSLHRRHRFDLLCELAQREGDWEAARRWALCDGRHGVAPAVCEALAAAIADARPLAAVELLGAAYRRSAEPTERHRIARRVRALTRRRPELARGWETLRRRWFVDGAGHGGRAATTPPSSRT